MSHTGWTLLAYVLLAIMVGVFVHYAWFGVATTVAMIVLIDVLTGLKGEDGR